MSWHDGQWHYFENRQGVLYCDGVRMTPEERLDFLSELNSTTIHRHFQHLLDEVGKLVWEGTDQDRFSDPNINASSHIKWG